MSYTHKELADGLRQLADWYEAHPEVAFPSNPEFSNYSVNTKEEAAAVMLALGSCVKEYTDEFFKITKKFGPVMAKFVCWRKDVCHKVVVGTKHVPEEILPARPEMLIPAHEEEIMEWQCDPILDNAETK